MKAMRYIVAILILAITIFVVVAGGWCDFHGSHSAPINTCINNLRQIDGAKEQWLVDKGKTTNDVPVMADLTNYMRFVPKCPKGGTYTPGPVGTNPKCSIKGHELPPPSAH